MSYTHDGLTTFLPGEPGSASFFLDFPSLYIMFNTIHPDRTSRRDGEGSGVEGKYITCYWCFKALWFHGMYTHLYKQRVLVFPADFDWNSLCLVSLVLHLAVRWCFSGADRVSFCNAGLRWGSMLRRVRNCRFVNYYYFRMWNAAATGCGRRNVAATAHFCTMLAPQCVTSCKSLELPSTEAKIRWAWRLVLTMASLKHQVIVRTVSGFVRVCVDL